MDTEKAFLVIGLTLIVVIVLNLAIFVMAKRKGGNPSGQIEMLSRVFKRARNPWEEERWKLKELSDQVAELQNQTNEDEKGEN